MVGHIFNSIPSHFGSGSAQPCMDTGKVALLLLFLVGLSLLENSSLPELKATTLYLLPSL